MDGLLFVWRLHGSKVSSRLSHSLRAEVSARRALSRLQQTPLVSHHNPSGDQAKLLTRQKEACLTGNLLSISIGYGTWLPILIWWTSFQVTLI